LPELAKTDRDGRLAETQFLGGARHVAVGMHRVEYPQQTKIDLIQARHRATPLFDLAMISIVIIA